MLLVLKEHLNHLQPYPVLTNIYSLNISEGCGPLKNVNQIMSISNNISNLIMDEMLLLPAKCLAKHFVKAVWFISFISPSRTPAHLLETALETPPIGCSGILWGLTTSSGTLRSSWLGLTGSQWWGGFPGSMCLRSGPTFSNTYNNSMLSSKLLIRVINPHLNGRG